MELQEGDLDFKIVKRLGLHPLHYCMIGICKSKYAVTSVDALNKHRQRVHQLGPIPPRQKGRPRSHDSHWPKKDPKKVQENNELRSFSLEFRMEMALKNLRRRLLEQEICKEKVNYEHELSSEALERIAGHLDAYKSNDIKRREDTIRRIELKKMFNELHCSKEGSSSTIGTNGGACNDYDNEISIESEKNNTHEVQEIVEKIGGLDLDDECSSSIMEGSSNASHEHIIEDYIEQAKQPSKTPIYGDQSSNKTIACEMNEDNYGFIEDCFQSDPQLDDTHDTPHMHITSDSRVNAETSAPQERATKHTKLTPKNLSKVGFRSRVAWLSHMQSNYIGRRKPIRISTIHGNTQCKK